MSTPGGGRRRLSRLVLIAGAAGAAFWLAPRFRRVQLELAPVGAAQSCARELSVSVFQDREKVHALTVALDRPALLPWSIEVAPGTYRVVLRATCPDGSAPAHEERLTLREDRVVSTRLSRFCACPAPPE